MAKEPVNTTEQRRKAAFYEQNYRQYARLQAKSTGGMVLKKASVEVSACPFMSIFNGWFPTARPAKETAERLQTALRLFGQTGQGMFCFAGPSTHEKVLRPLLLEAGFKCTYWVPYMHLDFADLAQGGRLPRGVSIEAVDDFSLFDREPHPWIGPITTDIRRAKIRFVRSLCTGARATGRQFVALKGGQVIGGVMILCHRKTAGVYDVMVDKAFRRQGIGAELMKAACREARERGMGGAVLSASGQGRELYLRIGFADAGRYGSYFLSRAGVRKFS